VRHVRRDERVLIRTYKEDPGRQAIAGIFCS
jgi:hypothetical protein